MVTLGNRVTLVAGINNTGLVVGLAYLPGAHAVLWRNRKIEDIGKEIPAKQSSFIGVNNTGTIVGYSEVNQEGTRVFVFRNGKFEYLSKNKKCIPRGINKRNDVVGYQKDKKSDFCEAVLFKEKRMVLLGRLDGRESNAFSINDLGLVVGQLTMKNFKQRGFLWHNGKMLDLNGMINRKDIIITAARAINNQNFIVGTAEVGGKESACLLIPESS
ncbi:MAG: hypothetical protein NTX57_09405 [Armatimonadetes bacterium]|nr:hypothetical protein [Armatimonadota bacterium]